MVGRASITITVFASYLVGAGLAWVSVHVAFVVYALTPLFYITPPEGRAASKR
jgi:hypothetical protein